MVGHDRLQQRLMSVRHMQVRDQFRPERIVGVGFERCCTTTTACRRRENGGVCTSGRHGVVRASSSLLPRLFVSRKLVEPGPDIINQPLTPDPHQPTPLSRSTAHRRKSRRAAPAPAGDPTNLVHSVAPLPCDVWHPSPEGSWLASALLCSLILGCGQCVEVETGPLAGREAGRQCG